MGKRARARARSQAPSGEPALQWTRGDPGELFERLAGDAAAAIWLLPAGGTSSEPLRAVLDAEDTGLPVALIEPVHNALVQHGDDAYDIRIAIATKMGLPRAGPIAPRPAAGWALGPRQGKWELTDPAGTLIASCEVSAGDAAGEPAWTAQAMAAGQILIAYGTRVGVRVPEGEPASHYDDRYRAGE
jgi:hypothetical protein